MKSAHLFRIGVDTDPDTGDTCRVAFWHPHGLDCLDDIQIVAMRYRAKWVDTTVLDSTMDEATYEQPE